MGTGLVASDWPRIRVDEARELLNHFSWIDDEIGTAFVLWTSPRPMSAAALVRKGTTTVFVKRHHVTVRSRARLEREHQFARHLRGSGVAVPAVLATTSGATVIERDDYVYEVHDSARGVDLYRDVASWYPFVSPAHAVSAGRALANFHRAARDFAAPTWDLEVLSGSVAIVDAEDPSLALRQLVEGRRGLALALAQIDYEEDFKRCLLPWVEKASPHLGALRSQWTHGDWHASNLTWSSYGPMATVCEVLDLGLSNRTYAVHDLAVAIERNAVDWLDVARCGSMTFDEAIVDALLDGYEQVAPLAPGELSALVALLPVAHLEFALSEVEYFADVVHSPSNTALAYEDYLLGHARWFEGPIGSSLLAHLERRG
jgi:Ser/Thr protein kinase RdoA (MazF antagonist)